MNKQDDAFFLYEATARELLNHDKVQEDPAVYRRALKHQEWLSKNVEKSRRHGDTGELRAERCRIINELNKLAVWKLHQSFVELCAQVETEAEQEPTEHLPHIVDPLRSAKLGPEGHTRYAIQDIVDARSHANCQEALCICNNAVKCISKNGDQTELALAYLYQADAQARNNQLEQGIELAERARRILEMRGDRHNIVVSRLLLARLQAAKDISTARLEYREALDCCQKLESETKQSVPSEEAQLYEQIIYEIQLILTDDRKVLREQYVQRYLLKPISVLELSDGPDVIIRPARLAEFIITGDFRIEGQTYFLCLQSEAVGPPELQAGATHFALPVPEDGWLGPISKKQDYALVRQEAQYTREGPAVSWMEEEWIEGHFTRDKTTGRIFFSAPARDVRIIGQESSDQQGRIVGLFKPAD